MYLWKRIFGNAAGQATHSEPLSNQCAASQDSLAASVHPKEGPGSDVIYGDWSTRQVAQAESTVQQTRLVKRFGKRGHGKGHLDMPCGLAVTKQGDIIVADTENNRLQVFDGHGNLKVRIGQKGASPHQLNHPMCVTLTRDEPENVLVTDSVNACVKVFQLDGTFVNVYCEFGVFDFPYGIAISRDHYIVVTDICKHNVTVLYPSGCEKLRFGQYGDGVCDFDHPYFLAVGDDDRIVVSDSGNTSIKTFTMEGQILQSFNMFDFRLFEEHFVMLQGIMVDPEGHTLVIGNSTVYIVAKNGRFWEVLLPEDGLHAPKCLAFNSTSSLLVVTQASLNQKHEVAIFRYPIANYRSLRSVPAACFVTQAGERVPSDDQSTLAPSRKASLLGKNKGLVVKNQTKRTRLTENSSCNSVTTSMCTSTSPEDELGDHNLPES